MTLNVGLVGCGHISAAHLRGWRRAAGCRVSGLFDLDAALASRRARGFGVPRVHDDLDRLISTSDVVDVCTPPATHAEIAGRTLRAGRHLLIEKPLVTELSEWEALLEVAAGSSAVITVVHNIKFAHGVQVARRWLDEGRIGRLIRLSRRFLTSPERDRMLEAESHWSHRLPGGRWLETLPHALYLTHHLAGPLELADVVALATSEPPGRHGADEVLVTLAGEDRVATIEYSARCRANTRTLSLIGTEGRIELDLLSGAVWRSTVHDRRWKRAVGVSYMEAARTLAHGVPERAGHLLRRLRGVTPHGRLIAALADHLRGEGPPPTPLDEIDYVIRNCDRIGRAIDRRIGTGRGGD